MPSLLRRMLSGQGSRERAARVEDSAAKNVAVEEPPVAEAQVAESAVDSLEPAGRTGFTELEVGPVALDQSPEARGLIRADQLPSAAKALAELFPPENEIDPFLSDATEVESFSTAERTDLAELAQGSRVEDVQELAQEVAKEQSDEITAARVFAEAAATAPDDTPANDDRTNEAAAVEAGYTATGNEEATVFASEENAPLTGIQTLGASEEIAQEPPAIMEGDKSADVGGEEQNAESRQPEHTREAQDAEIVKAASMAVLESPASSSRDWKLEEKLASHLDWLDSRGKSGLHGDLSDADLEGQELIGVKLRFADLHDANLRAADLLLADLRDANLMRADLEDACLVGANLEAANLEGASLETAMGLVPRQIAGANLRDALLPPQIMEFDAAAKFARASRTAWRCFAPLIPAVVISWLIIWKTKDAQLLTDSAAIPFLHSRTAAAALPTEQIFLLAPLVILGLYLVFQFQLQKVWQAALELPAIFPDGHSLDDRGPGMIVGLLRTHFWWIGRDTSSTMWVEKTISILAGYWAVPFTLTLFWARYLSMQEMKGTLLQALLVAIATGVALHATMRTGRVQERWAGKPKWTAGIVEAMRRVSPAVMASGLGIVLLLLSVGTLSGVPHEHSRAPQYSPASIRRWAADVMWSVGFNPYPDLTEAMLSRKPPKWNGSNAQVASVTGPQLNEAKLRYAQAYGVFLANAHLWQSDLEGAYLSEADLRGADLGNSDLRLAVLDGALLEGANLNRAQLGGAVLARADLRWANLSYASLANAVLVDSRLGGATLYDAQMSSASLARANLEKADLRGASLNAADLDHADLQQALLWSAKLPGTNLYGAKLQGAVAIDADLRGADLREAQFAGTVLNDANLSGSNLDRADLRGALELTPSQVCSSKSRRGALLDAVLATQVAAECGGLQ